MRAIPHAKAYTSHSVVKIVASIAASTLVVSASPWVPHKRVDAGLSTNRFAGRTVTIALPGAIKTDIGLFKEDWERQTGARLKVIASD